jgi:hypothetical protein
LTLAIGTSTTPGPGQDPTADSLPVADADAAEGPAEPADERPAVLAEPGEERPAGSGPESAPATSRRLLTGWPLQIATGTLLLAVLSHLRWGYLAGDRDHAVLSPMGMRWADPDTFANDWFLTNAPQPHWLFDVITWIGASTGTLGGIYLLYWIAGMVAFSAATTLLARTWVPERAWIAIGAVSIVASLAPAYVLGSGAHLHATPLPNSLGGCLLYLCAAALLVGRHRLAAAAAVATALAHVQHGLVGLVLLLLVTGLVLWQRRTLDRYLVGASAVTVGLVMFNLWLRPVAGHLSDFQDVCRTLIPLHCEATLWSWSEFYGGIALIALGLLSVLYVPAAYRLRWAAVVALPIVGLIAGVAADRFDVPTLGLLVQGLNVYRLSVLLLQFAIWGALVAALARLTARQRWIALTVTLVLGWYAAQPLWAFDGNTVWPYAPTNKVMSVPLLLLAAVALVVTTAVQSVPGLTPRPEAAARLSTGAVVLMLLISAVAGNHLRLSRLDPSFFPYRGLTAWGEQVQDAVPPDEQLLVPPWGVRLRMATHRAVVVDCKLAPYGGEAWQEFRRRITDLGGFAACGPDGWRALPTDRLIAAAGRYGARYVVLSSEPSIDGTHADELVRQGWTLLVPAGPDAPYQLYRKGDQS